MLITPSGAAFIDESHAATYAQKNYRKNRKAIARRAEKIERQAFNKRKQALNESDLKWQKTRLKRTVHELVKLLDANEPCIVCNSWGCGEMSEWDAGHYLTKAAHPELKFDPRNIFKQCSPTNTASSGNKSGQASIRQKFEQNIINRYGMDLLLWLKGYHPPRKYTCDEMAGMWHELNDEVKRLKRGEPPSRDWRAIPNQEGSADEYSRSRNASVA